MGCVIRKDAWHCLRCCRDFPDTPDGEKEYYDHELACLAEEAS